MVAPPFGTQCTSFDGEEHSGNGLVTVSGNCRVLTLTGRTGNIIILLGQLIRGIDVILHAAAVCPTNVLPFVRSKGMQTGKGTTVSIWLLHCSGPVPFKVKLST